MATESALDFAVGRIPLIHADVKVVESPRRVLWQWLHDVTLVFGQRRSVPVKLAIVEEREGFIDEVTALERELLLVRRVYKSNGGACPVTHWRERVRAHGIVPFVEVVRLVELCKEK